MSETRRLTPSELALADLRAGVDALRGGSLARRAVRAAAESQRSHREDDPFAVFEQTASASTEELAWAVAFLSATIVEHAPDLAAAVVRVEARNEASVARVVPIGRNRGH